MQETDNNKFKVEEKIFKMSLYSQIDNRVHETNNKFEVEGRISNCLYTVRLIIGCMKQTIWSRLKEEYQIVYIQSD